MKNLTFTCLLVIIFLYSNVYADEPKILKDIDINLYEYSENEYVNYKLDDVFESYVDTSFVLLVTAYISDERTFPILVKLNSDLEVQWVQAELASYQRDIAGFVAFEIDSLGNSMAIIAHKDIDSLQYNDPNSGFPRDSYLYVTQFLINRNGDIISEYTLGVGDAISDTSVFWIGGWWNDYNVIKSSKRGNTFILHSNQTLDTFDRPTGEVVANGGNYINDYYFKKLSTSPLKLTDHQMWSQESYFRFDDLFEIPNKRYIKISSNDLHRDRPKLKYYAILDTNYQCIYDNTTYKTLTDSLDIGFYVGGKLINDSLNLAIFTEDHLYDYDDWRENQVKTINIHLFDKDGKYQGIKRTVDFTHVNFGYPYGIDKDLMLGFDENTERLYGMQEAMSVSRDTITPDSIIVNKQYYLYFLFEKELGELDTLMIHENSSFYTGYNNILQQSNGNYLLSAMYINPNDSTLQIHLAQVESGDFVGINDTKAEIERDSRNLNVYKVYPNPTNSIINVDFYCNRNYLPNIDFKVYDYLGIEYKNIKSEIVSYDSSWHLGTAQIELNSVPSGIKFVVVQTGGEAETKGFIIY